MNIMQRVNKIKEQAAERGDYRIVAEQSGVTFHWLQKFAIGKIPNPGVKNIAKLEDFFLANHEPNQREQSTAE